MSRIVVTGAAGFVGSSLVEHLLADGHEVVGLDCFTDYYSRKDKLHNLKNPLAEDRFTFVEADLRVDQLEPHLEGADAVVNEAATPGLTLSWMDFDRYQSTNLSAVKRLADASVAVGVDHFIQASTSSVYGANAIGDEESPTVPVSPYGVTKLAAEHLLRAYGHVYQLPYTILRYYSIYGPRQRPDMAYRIFCEGLLRGEPIKVFGDGRQSRSNTYISDCVAATAAAIACPAEGRIFNIGGGREITLLEAIEMLATHLKVVPEIEYLPPRPGDQLRTTAVIDRARSILGWSPQVEPVDGLLKEAQWVVSRAGS